MGLCTVFASNVSFLSSIVPRYFYFSTTSPHIRYLKADHHQGVKDLFYESCKLSSNTREKLVGRDPGFAQHSWGHSNVTNKTLWGHEPLSLHSHDGKRLAPLSDLTADWFRCWTRCFMEARRKQVVSLGQWSRNCLQVLGRPHDGHSSLWICILTFHVRESRLASLDPKGFLTFEVHLLRLFQRSPLVPGFVLDLIFVSFCGVRISLTTAEQSRWNSAITWRQCSPHCLKMGNR